MAVLACDKLCIRYYNWSNPIKTWTEKHSPQQWINQRGILKKCSGNPKESRGEKQRKGKLRKQKNNVSPDLLTTTLKADGLNTPVKGQIGRVRKKGITSVYTVNKKVSSNIMKTR